MEMMKKLFHGGWKVSYKIQSVGFIFVMGMMIGVFYLGGDHNSNEKRFNNIIEEDYEAVTLMKNSSVLKSCDFFNGSWVYDNKSRPLYKEKECPFMTDDYACEKYGRKNLKYQQWRWQPHGCDLPRFNGRALLEQLRNKRVVLVGDSLGRNQWVSLICLINSWIPDPSQKVTQWHDTLLTFKAYKYNASIDFYWEPLLVESNCDDPVKHRVRNRILRIENIERHAKQWIDADILIFDSYKWWLEPKYMTLLWGSFKNPNRTYFESGRVRRYKMALKTWSNWLDTHLNRTMTKLFFTSLSPDHTEGSDWGKVMGENCFNETEPIMEERYWGKGTETDLMRTAESVVQDLERKGLDIRILNITQLSQYRKDGHPSINKKYWELPSESELAIPILYADCVHWCLPGVPDVWNEILYSYILYKL